MIRTTYSDMEMVLRHLSDGPDIDGLFHAAAVINDFGVTVADSET